MAEIDFYEITVNGITWEISDRTFMAEGADALAYTSFTYSDLVLLIFPHRYSYKYDWLYELDLVLGESDYEDNYVLILPFMDEIDEPSWYNNLWGMLHRQTTKEGYNILTKNARGYYDQETTYWINRLIDFLDKYPKYKTNRHAFDLHSGNVMAYEGRAIPFDPIWERR